MSKPAFNTIVSDNIKDNNNKYITPARHRTVINALRDYIGWLAEINTWTAINIFDSGTRTPYAQITGAGTVTITSTKNHQIIKPGVTQVNLPASPTDGDWYELKNASGATATISGNGVNIYTSSNNATRTVASGGSFKIRYNSTDNLWYNYS